MVLWKQFMSVTTGIWLEFFHICSWYLSEYRYGSTWFLHVETMIYFPYYFCSLKIRVTVFYFQVHKSLLRSVLSKVEGNFIHSKWTISINSSFLNRVNSPFRAPWFVQHFMYTSIAWEFCMLLFQNDFWLSNCWS